MNMEEEEIWLKAFFIRLEAEEKMYPGGASNINTAEKFADEVSQLIKTKNFN